MTIIYITFGGSADYGHFDKHMLLFLSCVWWFTQLGLIGISDPSHWPAAMALYIVGFSACEQTRAEIDDSCLRR